MEAVHDEKDDDNTEGTPLSLVNLPNGKDSAVR